MSLGALDNIILPLSCLTLTVVYIQVANYRVVEVCCYVVEVCC